jgi:DNA-binding transcriptional LysR family regulator
MELRHLRYFVAVAELGSVSRAAEKLFIAQPPLSKQIKQLEDEIGVKLLLRYPRGVRLTDAGAAFLIEAKDLLARSERAKKTARHTNSLRGGAVRIGYVPSAGHVVLPRFLDELRRIRPDAEIDVQEMIAPQQVQALCAGEIDVGLARAPVNSARIVVAAELEDPFCLALPSRHALSGSGPIDLRAAADCTFVSSARQRAPAYFDQALALCSDAGFSPKLRYEASTLYGVLALVGAGLGVAIVPSSAVMLAPKGFTLRPLSRPTRGGSLAFVQLRGDPNPFIATLAKLATAVFAKLRKDVELSLSVDGRTAPFGTPPAPDPRPDEV